MLARLLVSARLMSGMFGLACRLIRVRLCLASAWPISLRIVRERAVAAFVVHGAFRELGGTCLDGTLLVCVRGAFHKLGGTHLGGTLLVCSVRGAASAMPFLVTLVCLFA